MGFIYFIAYIHSIIWSAIAAADFHWCANEPNAVRCGMASHDRVYLFSIFEAFK